MDGTLAELRHLLPPAEVEYVEKQPTLEDIFLALTTITGEHRAISIDDDDDAPEGRRGRRRGDRRAGHDRRRTAR